MVTRESTKWRKLIAEKRYITGWRLRVYLLVRAATIILRLPGKDGAKAKAALDRCRQRGWQVVMLGADFDNAGQAASLGNNPNATMRVSPSQMKAALSATATKRGRYGATGQSMAFNDAEKNAFGGK